MWKTKTGTENKGIKWKTRAKKVVINPTMLIINLNVNGLNTPIRRQGLSEWITKQDPVHIIYKKHTLNIRHI